MSAIDYANSQDWLAYLNGKKKTQDKIPTTNVFGGFPFSAPSFADGGKMKRKKRGKMAENRLIEEPGVPLFAYGGSLKTASTPTVEPVGVFDNGKDTLFALGGVLQSHGSDWGNGATHIDAGGSHEENVNDGVQMGVDQNGTPNLVEEGEVVFNDYVYSKRIYLDEEAKKAFHISKNRDITYADMAKKLEKESEERPNDPISAAALKAQMQDLADQQERQKQEMEAERAEEAFNALSDEEKVALMQQAAEQEQVAQEQAMAEEQAMQQPSPEEMAAMEQQAAMGQQMSPEEAAIMQQQMAVQGGPSFEEMQANVSALGGVLSRAGEDKNILALAGPISKKTNRRLLRHYDEDWFYQQAKALGMDDEWIEENMRKSFKFDPDNAEANMNAFNNIYRRFQEDRARRTYREGQRKSKANELFDANKGLYRMSDDGKVLYKAKINDANRKGWINKDYTGDTVDDLITGFLTDEEYNKKRALWEAETDKDKKAALLAELEGYKPIDQKMGDRMIGYNGQVIWGDPELDKDGNLLTKEGLLDSFTYDDGFKWDEKDVNTLDYPAEMETSNVSKLRYAPLAFNGLGLLYNALTPADYSRAEAVTNIGSGGVPSLVHPDYRGNYATYIPVDPWLQKAPLIAQANSVARGIRNSGTNQGAMIAGQLGLDYNTNNALGQADASAQLQNFDRRMKVLDVNNNLDKTYMALDMEAQKANQNALLHAGDNANRYRFAGLSMMEDIDRNKSNAISLNATNLAESARKIGEEGYDMDRLKWLNRAGVLKGSYWRGKYGGQLSKKGGR